MKSPSKTAYIAGGMSAYVDKQAEAFDSAAALLRRMGYKVINPMELDRQYPEPTYERCLARDLKAILDAYLAGEYVVVAQLGDWQESGGAVFEFMVTNKLKIKAYPWSELIFPTIKEKSNGSDGLQELGSGSDGSTTRNNYITCPYCVDPDCTWNGGGGYRA